MVRDKTKNVVRPFRELYRRMQNASRKNRNHELLIWILGALVIGLLFIGPCLDCVYGAEKKQEKLVLLLAQTCVAEIGFEGTIAECELMWSINQRNAIKRNRSLIRQTKLFNSYWKVPHQRKRRPWIKHLNGIGQPKRWPSTINWQRYAADWINVKNAATAFAYSHRQFFHDCREAIDYGAPGETPRMQPYLKKLKCLGGKSRQRYWAFKNGKKS